jgi:transposase-like protein
MGRLKGISNHGSIFKNSVTNHYSSHALSETAEAYGISQATVRKWAIERNPELSGSFNGITMRMRNKAVEYYKTHTSKETADKFGVHETTIRNWWKQSGLKPGDRLKHLCQSPFSEKLRRDAVEYYKTHMQRETLSKYGISLATLSKWLRDSGVHKIKGTKALKRTHYSFAFRDRVVKYYKNNTLHETMTKFGIPSPNTIVKWAKNGNVYKR